MEIPGNVLRAARQCLKYSVQDVAGAADVSPRSVNRVEADDPMIALRLVVAVRRVLEDAGIKFLPATAENGPGFVTPLEKSRRPLRKDEAAGEETAEAPSTLLRKRAEDT